MVRKSSGLSIWLDYTALHTTCISVGLRCQWWCGYSGQLGEKRGGRESPYSCKPTHTTQMLLPLTKGAVRGRVRVRFLNARRDNIFPSSVRGLNAAVTP